MLRTGCRIPFSSPPSLSAVPVPILSYSPTSIKGKALHGEVLSLIIKGAVELAPPFPGYYSCLFVVWKAAGSWRPLIDLSHLNRFVQLTLFKMETNQLVLRVVRRDDWMFSIDFKDAYLQVLIHPDSCRYLRFVADGQVYQFKALWPLHTPSGIHQGHGSCVSCPSRHGRPDTLVSGRLVGPRLIQSGGPVGKGQGSTALSPAWHCCESGQVTSHPFSLRHVSGDVHREPLFECFSLAGEGIDPEVSACRISILQAARCRSLTKPSGHLSSRLVRDRRFLPSHYSQRFQGEDFCCQTFFMLASGVCNI